MLAWVILIKLENGMKKLLIGLAVLIAVAGIAVLMYKQNTTGANQIQLNQNDNNTITPNSSTSSWPVYTNVQQGYSIKYPNDWTFSTSDNKSVCFGQNGVKYYFEGTESKCAIRLLVEDSSISLEDRVKNRQLNNSEYEAEYFKVDGAQGVTIHPIEETYIQLGNKTYTIDTIAYADGAGVEQLGNIISKMVSTLQFN